ncbi:hypothetical protein EVB97_128 [Rhizobium phage RHph_Y65]|uniref:Uncharacterized protein n=1 Tax=Rhizobium phage RHph_Y65 TaxID=2509785 RepID=A0A7S5R7S8_9CAUD|nr:hypothetical protein PQC17_gp128 [Rhizobium phage RHph_Y65]QIG72686.1 hypothetical protein EVB97_128 [Rhizobium phage RHph_Y65]
MIYRVWYWSSKGYWKHFQDQENLEYAQASQTILFKNSKASIMQIVPKNHPFTDRVIDMTDNMYVPDEDDDPVVEFHNAVNAFNLKHSGVSP